jgi:ubiquinone/menaquinone biosynthesis C-methylase UbiE
VLEGGVLTGGRHRYPITESGIPLFAEGAFSDDARRQEAHYDAVADAYLKNLTYPHTQEYMGFLDRVFLEQVAPGGLGTVAEICCGRGEAFELVKDRIARGVGVDVSTAMLEVARREHPEPRLTFVQGDATHLPLASGAFDSVFILGGIHHVNDRRALFGEVARILKPNGTLYFREPVSDFFLWRWLRAAIYRLSPGLDHETERPLLLRETVPVLEQAGLRTTLWKTHGFLGFCLFMNSDILFVNRLFRFVPGIRGITRASTVIDEWTTALPGLSGAGLQVVGVARKADVDAI